jgi:hypothetical protein
MNLTMFYGVVRVFGALNYVEFRAATNPTWFVAEREGFEPSVPILVGTHDFQSCPFGRSGISP